MSLFEDIENKEKSQEVNQILIDLINELKSITEYSDNELKAISMLQSDIYLSELLKFYISNKKHLKRKYSKEITGVISDIANMNKIGGYIPDNNNNKKR